MPEPVNETNGDVAVTKKESSKVVSEVNKVGVGSEGRKEDKVEEAKGNGHAETKAEEEAREEKLLEGSPEEVKPTEEKEGDKVEVEDKKEKVEEKKEDKIEEAKEAAEEIKAKVKEIKESAEENKEVVEEKKETVEEKMETTVKEKEVVEGKMEAAEEKVEVAKEKKEVEGDEKAVEEKKVEDMKEKKKVVDDKMESVEEKKEVAEEKEKTIVEKKESVEEKKGGKDEKEVAVEKIEEGSKEGGVEGKEAVEEAKGESEGVKEKVESSEETAEPLGKEAEVDKAKETVNKPAEVTTEENKDEAMEVDEASMKEEVKPSEAESNTLLQDIKQFMRDGTVCLVKRDFAAAADNFGQACEKGRELYGEMAPECATLFYHYGLAMLECGKTENGLLGESVKQEEENEESSEGEEEGGEEEASKVNGEGGAAEEGEPSKAEEGEAAELNLEEEDKKTDEDSPLRIAWEMFELAKLIYLKEKKEAQAAEMYMKLSEVGVESGHPEAIDDIKAALEIRKRINPQGHRIIAETHFHMGLGYSFFQKFDEAIQEFETSKKILENKIAELEKVGTAESMEEIKEIKELLPDMDEKIADMVESKAEKLKAAEAEGVGLNGESKVGESSGVKTSTSNISHLVKRKRKIDEVTTDLAEQPPKQVCLEETEQPKVPPVESK